MISENYVEHSIEETYIDVSVKNILFVINDLGLILLILFEKNMVRLYYFNACKRKYIPSCPLQSMG